MFGILCSLNDIADIVCLFRGSNFVLFLLSAEELAIDLGRYFVDHLCERVNYAESIIYLYSSVRILRNLLFLYVSVSRFVNEILFFIHLSRC